MKKKNKETVENCLQITVELKFILKVTKANLILDEIMLNIPFNFPIPRSFHSFLRAPFFSQLWLIKAKLFGQELFGFGQPNFI